MAFRLFVDSSTGVTLNPEYDYVDARAKIEDRHRARDGTSYFYKWGAFDKISFSVEYVNSATQSTVNSWWESNTPLFFKDETSAVVYNVCLTNDQKPIGEFNKPYNNLFRGVIELEGR